MGGRRFTYMNAAGDKHSKLDRFLVSLNAFESWPNLNVTTLPRVHSDHCAILLSASHFDFGPSPFKFYNYWLKDLRFEDILRRGWSISNNPRHRFLLSPLSLVTGKLKNLKEHIKAWRKETIKKARKEIDELTKKLNDIDLLAERGQANEEQMKSRQNTYKKIMELESRRIEDLKQKSRAKWALDGDENNVFFHGLINKHRRTQRINGIKENGFWINDPVEIKEMFTKHFAGRFAEPIKSRPKFLNPKFNKLPPYAIMYLEEPFSFEEIKSAIWARGSDRAPGPDGFSFAFLKQHWDVIGGDFYLAVKHFEATGHIDKGCNSSFITLIPKVQDPITITDFRPISLLGCFYKSISKVLAERLKKISVIINGSATTEFGMERGVRQGDPLSPFLFIIAAEGLNIAMETTKEKGLFEGLKINMSKCKLYWVGTQDCELDLVARSFNCSMGSFPFTYLGLPVGASMARTTHWKPIIERFQAKLSRWKASTLSYGGRLTLCKAVLISLGSFYFSLYRAPVKVIKSIERIRMSFFWGGCSESRKIAWITWEKILAAKERGGLGIGSLKAQNYALLGKWWWRFMRNPNSIWAMVIKSIHGPDGGFSRPLTTKRRSGCWGSTVCLPIWLEKDQVSFVNHFNQEANVDGSLKWTWSLESSGVYIVSSLRVHIDNLVLPHSDDAWVWNQLNILAWRVALGKLPCMENLSRIGVSSSNLCRMCNESPEWEDHIFVGCMVSREV
uniref:Reverse transcriptase zinc-binding domain-containing protein n=1 Tax=Lactuca sativa TaxID=4236 RepID=A0A9R1X9S2_LACSA|nr:hypothetical protein LSAT_V11C500242840 [Lactuca sativa]